MQNLFECKVKYLKIDEKTGSMKKVSETYLVDAVSCTEAEVRINKELDYLSECNFSVLSVKKANYAEIFPFDDGDRWYKSKISFVSIDGEAGKEKKVSNQILVLACDVKDAFHNIHEGMSGMTVDFDINMIAESPIVDFFPYFQDEEIPSNSKPLDEVEEDSDGLDELFTKAAYLVVEEQNATISLLQRRFLIGYNRAGRLMDELENSGIVGPFRGAKPRVVLIVNKESLKAHLKNEETIPEV